MTAAVFLDRDGVLNELVPDPDSGKPESPLVPEQVALVAGAAGAIRTLRTAGYVLVVVSNQPAAAKATVGLERLRQVQNRVLELLEREGAGLDAVRICFHHPDGVGPELSGPCDCRKPAPGMLFDAARELALDLRASWMVGDTDGDVAAGSAARCHTVLVENPHSAHKRTATPVPDVRASDLAEAARLIVALDRR